MFPPDLLFVNFVQCEVNVHVFCITPIMDLKCLHGMSSEKYNARPSAICRLKTRVAESKHVAQDKMAGQKRLSASIENKEFESSSNKKRRVSVSTFEKWQGQFDKDHSTLTWLR